jgi:hypothetical protein
MIQESGWGSKDKAGVRGRGSGLSRCRLARPGQLLQLDYQAQGLVDRLLRWKSSGDVRGQQDEVRAFSIAVGVLASDASLEESLKIVFGAKIISLFAFGFRLHIPAAPFG